MCEFAEIEKSFYMRMTSADKHEMSSRFRVLHYRFFTARMYSPAPLQFLLKRIPGFEDSRVQVNILLASSSAYLHNMRRSGKPQEVTAEEKDNGNACVDASFKKKEARCNSCLL
jgi:hypothetical protein